jgi:transcription elongation factor GreA
MKDEASSALTLGEAATQYLTGLPPEGQEESRPEVQKFVRWFGRERLFPRLSAPEVANYAERLSLSDTDYVRKLELVRAFLAYAKRAGWSPTSLGVHLKAKKGKPGSSAAGRQGPAETVPLTRQGYTELQAELTELKNRRPELIEEIRRAAADKDFKENAPLAAAREQRGYLEGRIKELEATLKVASIIDEEQKSGARVSVGANLVLRELSSGEELHYQVVTPREVDPARGKISSASPLGRVLMGKEEGEVVEVTAPAGNRLYRIEQIRC